MKVSECMTRDMRIATPDQPIREAARFMLSADTGSIPVCDGERLVGMLTDRDIAVRAVAEGRGADTPVSQIMTGDPVCGYEDDDVAGAAVKMSENKIRRLPIVSRNDDKLVGMLSLGDISQIDSRSAEHTLEEVTEPSPMHNQSREM